ncbi:PQQ-like beta-propeller repeat protein [Sphingomonas quercus]|uniref:PQQ-binding-like beta-propeller repeat protein n=1 Tax=Sphingomonas quercus TaxID=2842451 RepID=A0ABS6BLQ7_9SPHN|nr:PQQ-like beta-propeller repeat protein [Sphingomonas quercus]MBU3078701.1 PQQ-binding-like beta-propeller repeat protein [Sphingomonas quercus]
MRIGKRAIAVLAATALLSGCGMFRGTNKPKTPVLGERIPVLTYESGADTDPGLADQAVTLPAPQVNADWAQSGGSASKSLGQLALGASISPTWSTRIAGNSSKARLAAGPVVADGKLYVTDVDAMVRAIDAGNGRVLWSTSLRRPGKEGARAAFGGGVSYENGRVYATTGSGDIAALDAKTGAVIWKKTPAGPLRGAPTIANGQIYAMTQDNQLFALKQEDGAVDWQVAATLETAGVFGVAAPAAGQGTIVAGFSSGELTAYRYENGRVVWQDALSRTSISTAVASLSDIDADPVIDQGRVYAVGQGGRMVAMELTTGQRLWELNIAGIATPWVAGDWVFVVTDDARLLCVQRTSGKIRWATQLEHWRNEKKKTNPIGWTAPVLAGGRLILASTRGAMVEVSPADGKVTTTHKLGEAVYLRPIVANNVLYVTDQKGKITAWR